MTHSALTADDGEDVGAPDVGRVDGGAVGLFVGTPVG